MVLQKGCTGHKQDSAGSRLPYTKGRKYRKML